MSVRRYFSRFRWSIRLFSAKKCRRSVSFAVSDNGMNGNECTILWENVVRLFVYSLNLNLYFLIYITTVLFQRRTKGIITLPNMSGQLARSRRGPKLDECVTYHKWRILKSWCRDGVISQHAVFVYLTFLIDEIEQYTITQFQKSNFVN